MKGPAEDEVHVLEPEPILRTERIEVRVGVAIFENATIIVTATKDKATLEGNKIAVLTSLAAGGAHKAAVYDDWPTMQQTAEEANLVYEGMMKVLKESAQTQANSQDTTKH